MRVLATLATCACLAAAIWLPLHIYSVHSLPFAVPAVLIIPCLTGTVSALLCIACNVCGVRINRHSRAMAPALDALSTQPSPVVTTVAKQQPRNSVFAEQPSHFSEESEERPVSPTLSYAHGGHSRRKTILGPLPGSQSSSPRRASAQARLHARSRPESAHGPKLPHSMLALPISAAKSSSPAFLAVSPAPASCRTPSPPRWGHSARSARPSSASPPICSRLTVAQLPSTRGA